MNVHGGTGRPSRAAYGSTHPPMHASTWQRIPEGLQGPPATGCRRRRRARTTARSRRPAPSTRRWPRPSPRRPRGSRGRPARPAPPRRSSDALWNAACTVDGTTIDGFATEGEASRALHRQQHRLRTSRRHRLHGRARRVEQVAGEAEQVVLHRQQAGERGRVEAVGPGVRRHRLPPDPIDVRKPRVVDVGQRAPAVHRQVRGLASRKRASTSSISDLLLPARPRAHPSGTRQRPEAEQDQHRREHGEAVRDRRERRVRLDHVARSTTGSPRSRARARTGRARREAEGLGRGPHPGRRRPGSSPSVARPRPPRPAASRGGRPGSPRSRTSTTATAANTTPAGADCAVTEASAPSDRTPEARKYPVRLPIRAPSAAHAGVSTRAGPTKQTNRIVVAPDWPSTSSAR